MQLRSLFSSFLKPLYKIRSWYSVGKHHCSIFPRPMKVAYRIAFVIRIMSPSFDNRSEWKQRFRQKTKRLVQSLLSQQKDYIIHRIEYYYPLYQNKVHLPAFGTKIAPQVANIHDANAYPSFVWNQFTLLAKTSKHIHEQENKIIKYIIVLCH